VQCPNAEERLIDACHSIPAQRNQCIERRMTVQLAHFLRVQTIITHGGLPANLDGFKKIMKNHQPEFLGILLLAVIAIASLAAHGDAPSTSAAKSSLAPGYTETYSFKMDGKSIGTQTATLTKVEGGQQTWTFSFNLLAPLNGRTLTLKQTGIFALDDDARPVSLDTVITTMDGSPQREKVTFGQGTATVDLDPPIAAIAHTFPVPGHPYLMINNVITLLSIETRAAHPSTPAAFEMPSFNANSLQPIDLTLKPDGVAQVDGQPCHKYIVMPIANELALSDSTGDILSVTDSAQKLEIVKE